MVLPARQIRLLMIFLIFLINLEHASQLLARNHVLLSCARRLSERIWRLVPSVRHAAVKLEYVA
jgi:hypothetical protein